MKLPRIPITPATLLVVGISSALIIAVSACNDPEKPAPRGNDSNLPACAFQPVGAHVAEQIFSSALSTPTPGRIRSYCAFEPQVGGKLMHFVETQNGQLQSVALASSPQPAAASAPTGTAKIAVFLVNFQDLPTTFSSSDIQDVVFNQVDRFMDENSFHQFRITGQTYGPYTVAVSSRSCDVDDLAAKANQQAAAAGVNLSQYTNYLYVFDWNPHCGWAGLGTVGGNPGYAWINGYLDMHTVAHELGHNLGLWHSNAIDCGDSILRSGCKRVEYGDTADAMGAYVPGHFNAYQKDQLGWLGPRLLNVNSSGVYQIEPASTQTGNPKALKIFRTSESGERNYYYVEYRQLTGIDAALSKFTSYYNTTSGVLVHTGSDNDNDTSVLLNSNPNRRTRFQAALEPGQSLDDWTTGVSISLVSASSSSAQVQVNVGSPRGKPDSCSLR